MSDDTTKRLARAIRAFTVDMPNDQPNGDAERHLLRLDKALRRGDLSRARDAFAAMCGAQADQLRELRIAAESHLGGNFKDPEN